MDDGSVNRKGKAQEPGSCGEYAATLGELRPRIIPATHGELRDDIDPWNLLASLFILATG
jgi:hypothetical protein